MVVERYAVVVAASIELDGLDLIHSVDLVDQVVHLDWGDTSFVQLLAKTMERRKVLEDEMLGKHQHRLEVVAFLSDDS